MTRTATKPRASHSGPGRGGRWPLGCRELAHEQGNGYCAWHASEIALTERRALEKAVLAAARAVAEARGEIAIDAYGDIVGTEPIDALCAAVAELKKVRP